MPTENTPKTIEDIPEEHREIVTGLVGTAVTAGVKEIQDQFDTFKSEHNSALDTLKSEKADLEVKLAGHDGGSSTGTNGNELNDRQQKLIADQEDAKRTKDHADALSAKDVRYDTLSKSYAEVLRVEAAKTGVPKALLDTAETPEAINLEIARFKAYGGGGSGGDGGNGGGSGANGSGTNVGGAPGNEPSNDDEAAGRLLAGRFNDR